MATTNDKEKPGTSRARFRDDIEKSVKEQWKSQATDRNEWKRIWKRK